MATTPDANPDSPPTGAPDDIEQVLPAGPDREGVEDGAAAHDDAVDSPGTDGGTGGTGGTNHRSDRDITS
jgi:hypothetical protein